MQSIYTSASGLKNMQARLDTVASNISNVNTTGYKAKRLDFKDALYKALEVPKDPNKGKDAAADTVANPTAGVTTGSGQTSSETNITAQATAANTGSVTANADNETADADFKKYVLIGSGVIISSTTSDFSDGPAKSTGVSTDLSISGRGFFTLQDSRGETLYTRDGNFTVSSDGYLVNANGYYVLDNNGGLIQINGDSKRLGVLTDGTMIMPEGEIGKIGLIDFNNPDGLEAVGNTSFRATEESGQAIDTNKATITQGALENSNVDLADDMTMLVRSQRAFSLISKALQTADDMEGLANNMHK